MKIFPAEHKLHVKHRALLFFCFLFGALTGNAQNSDNDDSFLTNDTISLDEIVIRRSVEPQITGALSGKIKMNVEGVSNLPSLSGNVNLLKMLELTPGVQTSGDGNSNLYVRGGDAGQNLLSYNGNVIYTPGHILNFFPLFNVDHLSSVELVKSGVNSQHGGFLSSSISVATKSEIPDKTYLKGNVGLLSSQSTVGFRLSDKFGGYVSGRMTYLDLILVPLLNTMDEGSDNDIGCDFYDFNLTLIGDLDKNNRITFDAFTSEDKMNMTDNDIAVDGELKWMNYVLSVKSESRLSEDVFLEQAVRYSKFENKLVTAQAEMLMKLRSSITSVGYTNKINYSAGNIPFTSGIEYKYHDVLPQEKTIKNVGIEYNTENFGRNTAHDASLFTSAYIRTVPRFYFEPGIRYNLFRSKIENSDDNKTFHSVDLRFSGRYQLKEDKYLRAGFSRNTQYINKLTPSSIGLPTDFWLPANNKVLPQKGTEISFGYYQIFDNGLFEFSSDVYYKKMNNVTEFNQSFIENDNILFVDKIFYGKGQSYGWEAMIKKNTGKFTGWISYSLGRSERKFPGVNDGKTFPARYDRTHDLSVVGLYEFSKRWDVSAVYIYATGNTYTQPSSWYFMNGTPVKEYGRYNGARMPAYNRMDLGVNYWYREDNGFNFSVYNVFMASNPIYIFLLVDRNKKTDELRMRIKQKKLFTIVPSVSWKYKF